MRRVRFSVPNLEVVLDHPTPTRKSVIAALPGLSYGENADNPMSGASGFAKKGERDEDKQPQLPRQAYAASTGFWTMCAGTASTI